MLRDEANSWDGHQHQNEDDGDHDQQFHQRKAAGLRTTAYAVAAGN